MLVQHVRRMDRARLPHATLKYQPAGRRDQGRPLKRLLDGWRRPGQVRRPNSLTALWWWWWLNVGNGISPTPEYKLCWPRLGLLNSTTGSNSGLSHRVGPFGLMKETSRYRPLFLYRRELTCIWFVVFKCVSFGFLKNEIKATMFKFISVFLSFNKVCVRPLLLSGLQLCNGISSATDLLVIPPWLGLHVSWEQTALQVEVGTLYGTSYSLYRLYFAIVYLRTVGSLIKLNATVTSRLPAGTAMKKVSWFYCFYRAIFDSYR
jgi:hypothetical protein